MTNQSDGPTSVDVVGPIHSVMFFDAADQTSLVAQGDRVVSEDRQESRIFTITVDTLPIAGHFDMVRLIDAGRNDICQVRSWTLPLDGSPGQWELEAVHA